MDTADILASLSQKTGMRSPEKYVRIAITKNSKGYQSETTVSLRWDGDTTAYTAILSDLNREADALARLEIRHREFVDEHRAESIYAQLGRHAAEEDNRILVEDAAFTAAMKDGAR
jgi:hypothetical protein